LDHHSLLNQTFLRSKASRPAKVPTPPFEKFIFILLLVSAPICLVTAAFYTSGAVETVVYEGSQTVTLCILEFHNLPFLTAFTLFDIFVSVSLLVIFYKRSHALNDPSLQRDRRDEFSRIARLNLRCNCIILSCTIASTQIVLSLDMLGNIGGEFMCAWSIPISCLLFVIITTIIMIFERRFVWPSPPTVESEDKSADNTKLRCYMANESIHCDTIPPVPLNGVNVLIDSKVNPLP
jgi:hypothetical protein